MWKRSRGTNVALNDLRPAPLTDSKPPADSDPIRLRRLVQRPGDADAAVLVEEESRAAGQSASARPESTRGELHAMGTCRGSAVWAIGPAGEAVWRRKRSRGTGVVLSDLRPAQLSDPKPLRRGRGPMARRFGNESDSPALGFALPDPRPPNLVPKVAGSRWPTPGGSAGPRCRCAGVV